VSAVSLSNSASTNNRANMGALVSTTQANSVARGNSNTQAALSGGTAFDGNWHSVTFRRNGTAFTLFVDGPMSLRLRLPSRPGARVIAPV
jgi:hypothetical protein